MLFVFLFLAIPIFTLQQNFLGWGISNYLKSPQIWSWANFDGEHYLLIAPLPSFVIVLFPAFVLSALYLSKKSPTFRLVIYILLSILLGISTGLFVRGYWIA
jgi:hypothetical protein